MAALSAKVAVVTGSSRGIGAAIAKLFAQEGARVAVDGRDEAALSAVHADIERAGERAIRVVSDVTNLEAIESLRAQVESQLGAVDILVANAGGNPSSPAPIESMTEAIWRANRRRQPDRDVSHRQKFRARTRVGRRHALLTTGDGRMLGFRDSQVTGRALLTTMLVGAAAGAGTGAVTYFAFHRLSDGTASGWLAQMIVAEVYGILTASLLLRFRPVQEDPLALRPISRRDIGLAVAAWLAVLATSSIGYWLLQPLIGSPNEAARQVLSVATDAKRLQGQSSPAWAIAIARGCVLVPLFEELLFRGCVIAWLRSRWTRAASITTSAALFAGMHGYPIVMPFAFLFGLFSGWIRMRTSSTTNTWVMHVLNNVVFLSVGLWLFR